MELTFYGFDEPRTILTANPAHKTLAQILGRYAGAVEWCRLDGQDLDAWQDYIPQPPDHLTLWMRPGWSVPIIAGGVLTWGMLATQVAIAVVSFAITYGLGLLLANRQDPTQQQQPEQTFGVAGLSNTIVLGTPKFVVYGERRVFGHIISTQGGGSAYSVLYFMGEGEIADLRAVEINEIPIADFPNTSYLWRKGTNPQEVLALFERPIQVYSDGRQLLEQQPVVYQAHGDAVEEITLMLSVPYLQQVHIGGVQHSTRDPGWMDFRIERKRFTEGQWTKLYYDNTGRGGEEDVGGPHEPFFRIYANPGTAQQRFFSAPVPLPAPDRWQVRVTLIKNAHNDGQPAGTLYNVQEVRHHSGDLTYPHNALLAIYGVASAQIQSFESMKVSALVKGRLVKTWNGATSRRAYSRNRAWIVRDILTDPRVGMGHRIPEALWDDAAALAVATYYNATIDGEARDLCDLVANQRRPAVDWIRDLLTEGNAAVAQSNGKLKLLVDKPRAPVTGYLEGNVVRETVLSTLGSTGTPPNTVRGEFPDRAQNYRLSVIEVTAADIGAELPSEQTVSLQTVTRLSEATRKLAYALKKTRLVQRRFTWQSPLLALPSEPFDVVRLGYRTAQHLHGWGGYLQAGTTALNLVLDQMIPLQAGETYEVLIRTLATNDPYMARTFIATATRGQVTIAVAPASTGAAAGRPVSDWDTGAGYCHRAAGALGL
jgi:predicted phage tail protein